MTTWKLSTFAICLLGICLPASAQNSKNEQQLEGCIVRQGSYYFLQPQQGNPMRLQWSDPVSKNEGHQVRIEAHHSAPSQQETVANNGTTPHKSVTNGPSGDQAATSEASKEGDFVVDKLQVISATCPRGTKAR